MRVSGETREGNTIPLFLLDVRLFLIKRMEWMQYSSCSSKLWCSYYYCTSSFIPHKTWWPQRTKSIAKDAKQSNKRPEEKLLFMMTHREGRGENFLLTHKRLTLSRDYFTFNSRFNYNNRHHHVSQSETESKHTHLFREKNTRNSRTISSCQTHTETTLTENSQVDFVFFYGFTSCSTPFFFLSFVLRRRHDVPFCLSFHTF